jgi:hypothetical protein
MTDRKQAIQELTAERDRYKARAERAEAALKPFSEEAGWWFSKGYIASEPPVESFDDYQGVMTCGDLFNARAALAQIDAPRKTVFDMVSSEEWQEMDKRDSNPNVAEPVEPRQPTVKPLEWEESDTGDLICDTIVGRYQIQKGSSRWCCMYAMGVKHSKSNLPTWHKGPFSAKDAAQADYERRILSALAEGDSQ